MDHKKFQGWVSGIDKLSPAQKEQTQDLLSGITGENASLMAIEAQLRRSWQKPVDVRTATQQELLPRAWRGGYDAIGAKPARRPSTQQLAQLYRAFIKKAGGSPLETASPMG